MESTVFSIIALTSETCAICTIWKTSGEFAKFLKSFPDVQLYHIDPTKPPLSIEDHQRRHAIIGVGVPVVIAVLEDKWKTGISLTRKDILISPGYARSPQGIELFSRWKKQISNPKFLGYLILETSGACGKCKTWKESGQMDLFIKDLVETENMLLCHNSLKPPSIRIGAVPTIWFISAQDWSSPSPYLISGPPVQKLDDVKVWVKRLQETGSWFNNPNFIPTEIRDSAANSSSSHKSLISSQPKRQMIF